MSDQQSRRTLALALTTPLAAVALACVLLPGHVAAAEQEIAAGRLPKNIRHALGDVDIEKVEQETRNGAMTYAISIEAGEVEFELTLDAAGRLLSVETEDADDGDDKEVDDDDEVEDDQNEDNGNEHSRHEHSAAGAKPQMVDFDTLPKAAQSVLSKEAGQTAIEEIEREEKQGRVIFEAMWSIGGIKHEASVTSNGVLLNSEQVAAAESVPADVRSAAEAGLAGRGEISYERKLLVVFEAEVGAGKQKEELLLSPLAVFIGWVR